MATPKKKHPYAIYYNDGSYMIYDITQEDFDKITACMTKAVTYSTNSLNPIHSLPPTSVELSIGIISMKDIRSVIKQNPPAKVKKNEGTSPDLTEEEIEWMVANKRAWREDEGEYEQ